MLIEKVSIHAPARGATVYDLYKEGRIEGFNPRPCARGDHRDGEIPRGKQGFNPRPCARGDI